MGWHSVKAPRCRRTRAPCRSRARFCATARPPPWHFLRLAAALSSAAAPDLAGLAHFAPLSGHEDAVSAVGLCRVLPLAASAGTDGKAIIWDLHTMSQRGVCDCEADVIRLKWQPNGPCFFTGEILTAQGAAGRAAAPFRSARPLSLQHPRTPSCGCGTLGRGSAW